MVFEDQFKGRCRHSWPLSCAGKGGFIAEVGANAGTGGRTDTGQWVQVQVTVPEARPSVVRGLDRGQRMGGGVYGVAGVLGDHRRQRGQRPSRARAMTRSRRTWASHREKPTGPRAAARNDGLRSSPSALQARSTARASASSGLDVGSTTAVTAVWAAANPCESLSTPATVGGS